MIIECGGATIGFSHCPLTRSMPELHAPIKPHYFNIIRQQQGFLPSNPRFTSFFPDFRKERHFEVLATSYIENQWFMPLCANCAGSEAPGKYSDSIPIKVLFSRTDSKIPENKIKSKIGILPGPIIEACFRRIFRGKRPKGTAATSAAGHTALNQHAAD